MDNRETRRILLEWAESPTPQFRQSSPIGKGYGHGIYKVKSAVREKLAPHGGGLTALRAELKRLHVLSRTRRSSLSDHGMKDGICDAVAALSRRAEDYMQPVLACGMQKKSACKASSPKRKRSANSPLHGRPCLKMEEWELQTIDRMLAAGYSMKAVGEKVKHQYATLKRCAMEMGYGLKGYKWAKIETIEG